MLNHSAEFGSNMVEYMSFGTNQSSGSSSPSSNNSNCRNSKQYLYPQNVINPGNYSSHQQLCTVQNGSSLAHLSQLQSHQQYQNFYAQQNHLHLVNQQQQQSQNQNLVHQALNHNQYIAIGTNNSSPISPKTTVNTSFIPSLPQSFDYSKSQQTSLDENTKKKYKQFNKIVQQHQQQSITGCNYGSKKDINNFEDFQDENLNKSRSESCLGDDVMSDDEQDDDDDDELDDEDENDDDDYDDEDNYTIKKTKKFKKMNENDHENDFEIKNSFIGEENGVYVNSLFNSPSSISSSSIPAQNNQIDLVSSNYHNTSNTNINIDQKHKNYQNKSKSDERQSDPFYSGKNTPKYAQLVVTKTEIPDEAGDHIKHQDSSAVLNSNFSSTEVNQNQHQSFSHQSKTQTQHINNMINCYNLAGIMNDYELVNLPLRELNKRLRVLPKQMAYNMKKRRRTLKNRKYAQNCRSKRLEQKSEMEIQNNHLKHEINRLNKMIDKLQKENNELKKFVNNTSGISNFKDEKSEKSEPIITDLKLKDQKNLETLYISTGSNGQLQASSCSNNNSSSNQKNLLNKPLTPNNATNSISSSATSYSSRCQPHQPNITNPNNIHSQLTHLLSLPVIKTSNGQDQNGSSQQQQPQNINFT